MRKLLTIVNTTSQKLFRHTIIILIAVLSFTVYAQKTIVKGTVISA